MHRFAHQFITTFKTYREAIPFTLKHKLWKGILAYGWFAKFLIAVAILIGLKLIGTFQEKVRAITNADDVGGMIFGMGTMLSGVVSESVGFLTSGSYKYVMLIMLEVIIFHFAKRTLAVLSIDKGEVHFNAFLKAQIRMIKMSFIAWKLEKFIVMTILSIALGFIGLKGVLLFPLGFLVECYFLGFLIMDNYHEHFEKSIKESIFHTLRFAGVSTALGIVLYVFMLVPVAGPVIGPLLAAVTVSLVMFRLEGKHLQANTPLLTE